MKQIIKITLLMTAALLVLTACSDNSQMTRPEDTAQIIPADMVYASYQVPSHKGPAPEIDSNNPQWLERNVEAGYMFVSNDNSNLFISYYLFDGWQMSDIRLFVSQSFADLPRDGNGVPIPLDFKYQSSLDNCENVFTYTIPLADLGLGRGDSFALASQTVVGDRAPGPVTVCNSRQADSEWWFVGQGRVRTNLNGPITMERVSLPANSGQTAWM
ncbi:MAG: hypothetical protein K0B87_08735 [Candidatus Syntrophosphaera sp.]|nr:hypothetical protein [Candidatus Syntrophosphaera sp.]